LAAADAEAGRLSRLQWWCGEKRGWLAGDTIIGRPEPVFHNGSTEFSVHRDPIGGRYLQVQRVGFGASDIGTRTAERLTGPWSAVKNIYRPPESDGPNPFVYAGKAHAELKGGEVVISYAANGGDNRLWNDLTIYLPRFVRLNGVE
jgi:hypothetical protein